MPNCFCGACKCTLTKTVEKAQETDKIFKFLMGLNDSYEIVRGLIIIMDPKPSMDRAFSLVLQEERQRLTRHSNALTGPIESSALGVGYKRKDKGKMYCSRCRMNNHSLENC